VNEQDSPMDVEDQTMIPALDDQGIVFEQFVISAHTSNVNLQGWGIHDISILRG